jgi:hypothetical protein
MSRLVLKLICCMLFVVTAMQMGAVKQQVPSVAASSEDTATPAQAKQHKLYKLQNRVADHKTPDAIVFVPPGFNGRAFQCDFVQSRIDG